MSGKSPRKSIAMVTRTSGVPMAKKRRQMPQAGGRRAPTQGPRHPQQHPRPRGNYRPRAADRPARARIPERGSMDAKHAASLAPVTRKSGQWRGKAVHRENDLPDRFLILHRCDASSQSKTPYSATAENGPKSWIDQDSYSKGRYIPRRSPVTPPSCSARYRLPDRRPAPPDPLARPVFPSGWFRYRH